jgi:hypothetical protein
MNPTAIYSKSGKGVQEAAGKTSLLTRPDRAVLSAIDGRATLADVAQKVGKSFDAAFQTLIAQLDKNGFIRAVSPGSGAAAPKPGAKPAAKAPAESSGGDLDFSSFTAPPKPASAPASPPSKPAAPQGLDFSSLGTPSKTSAPAAPPPAQQSALSKAREEAEAKAQAERERLKKEAEAKTRAEMEAKLRAEAEKKHKEDAEAKAKEDAAANAVAAANAAAEAKVKAARDAALKAAEAKLKVEQEAKAKLEAERKAREETEKRLEVERKAREDTERKSKEEAERARKQLEEERRAREEAERKAKEEAERARKELEEERKRLEAERKREEEERAERRRREEEEAQARRKQKEEEERKAEEERAAKRKQREEEEAAREQEEQAKREAERAAKKKQREEEEAAREQQEEAEREAARAAKRKQREEEEAVQAAAPKPAAKAPAPKAEAPKVQAKTDSFADSLLADLDSFTNKDEEESKAKEEAERKAKLEAERRAREEAERQEKEEADRRRREADEQRRKEEEARRSREEEQRHAQEEERRKREADEIRRKAEAATAAAMAKEGKKVAPRAAEEDIPVSEDDLDMDEVNREKAALAKGKPKEKEPKPEKKKPVVAAPLPKIRRPGKWGKPVAVTLGLLLVVAIGIAHVVPLGTADYERVATEAFGRPVKIGSANLWLLTGLQVRFADVRVGDAKIAHVTGYPSPGSVFADKKEFSKIELDGFSLPQQAIGDALFATVKSDSFTVERIVVKSLEVPGPATLPKSLQADIALDAKGGMKNATVRGPDALVAKITPQDDGVIFELTAAGFTLPVAPQVTLSNFAMKGNATPRGMTIAEWGGSILGGAMTGTANVRWGGNWIVDGVVTVRNINAAVFAPALLSSGSAEGTGKFSMSAPDPRTLVSASRIDGNFTVSKGTLGSFDLARAIQSGGKQFAGSTQFLEMNGQGSYNRGAVSLRNVTIGAGALNAGASADISESGALSGRIVADVKTASRTLSATLLLGGTVKEPQVRN